MKRGILLVVVALASCKGGAGGDKKRVPGGQPASAAHLIKTIEAVSADSTGEELLGLAAGVAEECGKSCQCLALASNQEAGNKDGALFSCASVCTADARAKALAAEPGKRMATLVAACTPEGIGLTPDTANKVGEDWLAAFVSGQYLADAYEAANADDKKAYDAALKDFKVTLAPTAGLAGVSVAAATNMDTLGRGRIFVAVDAKGGIYAGRAPSVRFTPNGAELQPLLGKACADTNEMIEYVSVQWGRKLDQLGAPAVKTASQDDPPPPEPEEEAEGPVDDETGVGTAMALEEGKMGKKDAARVEGQYKMKNNSVDPQLARQQAIEAAKQAGIIAPLDGKPRRTFDEITATGGLRASFDDVDYGAFANGPAHSALGLASARIDDQIIVIADRSAPAQRVLEVLEALGAHGAILAVDRKGALAALPVVFGGGAFNSDVTRSWGEQPLDVVITPEPDQVTIDAGPITDPMLIKPTTDGSLDADTLEKSLSQLFKEAAFADRRDVVVSIKDSAKVAELIPALDAALSAGARAIRVESWYDRTPVRYGTIGHGSGTADMSGVKGRGDKVPQVSIGQPAAVGDLDKAIIRRYIKRQIAKITYCYEKQLLVKPGLAGTVNTQFFITPRGDVASSTASGVDPEVASCIAGVIESIEFPKPKGGGGVQVNYPFTFRPTGG